MAPVDRFPPAAVEEERVVDVRRRAARAAPRGTCSTDAPGPSRLTPRSRTACCGHARGMTRRRSSRTPRDRRPSCGSSPHTWTVSAACRLCGIAAERARRGDQPRAQEADARERAARSSPRPGEPQLAPPRCTQITLLGHARHERRRSASPSGVSPLRQRRIAVFLRGGAAPPMANRFRDPDRVLETTMPCGFLDRARVSSVPSPAHHRLPGSRDRTPIRGIPPRRAGEMRRRGTIGSPDPPSSDAFEVEQSDA